MDAEALKGALHQEEKLHAEVKAQLQASCQQLQSCITELEVSAVLSNEKASPSL